MGMFVSPKDTLGNLRDSGPKVCLTLGIGEHLAMVMAQFKNVALPCRVSDSQGDRETARIGPSLQFVDMSKDRLTRFHVFAPDIPITSTFRIFPLARSDLYVKAHPLVTCRKSKIEGLVIQPIRLVVMIDDVAFVVEVVIDTPLHGVETRTNFLPENRSPG